MSAHPYTATLTRPPTVKAAARRANASWWRSYVVMMSGSLLIGLVAMATAPKVFSLGLLVLIISIVAIVARPVNGVYVIVLFTLVGDGQTTPWWPFAKNFSSKESILFVSSGVIFSPLEVCIAAVAIGWLVHAVISGQFTFRRGRLLAPVSAFGVFILWGLINGIGRGGDSNVALWEARPLVYLVVLYVLITNVCTQRSHYQRLAWVVVFATLIDAIAAIISYLSMTVTERTGLESLGEHSASVHLNAVYLLAAGSWLYRGNPSSRRIALPLLMVPTFVAYLIAERRAAFVGLAVGLLIMAMVMFRENRRMFRKVVPVVALLAVGYTAAFWNSSGSTGFPARAVKGIIAPSQQSAADQSSDQYRVLESVDILTTVKSRPIQGIGFGQKFFRPIQLPDISFFVFWEYMPHNSLLWIWMKVGAFGFLACLYMFGNAIRLGIRQAFRAPPQDAALLLTAALFTVAYALYTYVDIAWDSQSMVLLAFFLAVIGNLADLPLEPEDRSHHFALTHLPRSTRD